MKLEARRQFKSGGRPWSVFNVDSGRFIEIRRETPEGKFCGYIAFFQLKRDAQAAIDAVTAFDAVKEGAGTR